MSYYLQSVLVVEADADEASRVSEVLSEASASRVTVLRVETLVEAVLAMADQSFDAVLLNLSLPDSQGIDTVRRLLALPPCPAVVVLTDPGDETAGLEAVRLGAQDYLPAGTADGPLLFRTLLHAACRRELVVQREQARAHLELRVDERTRELRQAVEALQEEVDARLRAEGQLRHSNELLECVFANTHVMLAYLDRQFNFIRVNRCYAEYQHRPESFFPGKRYIDVHPEMVDSVQAFEHIVRTGETLTGFEKLWVDTEASQRGTTCWNWSMVPVKDADGQVEGLVLSHQDVTESVRDREALRESERKEMEARLRAEEQLRHSNELLERVFANTHVMLAYLDRQFNFVRVNRCYAEYKHREESFFPGKSYFELHPDEAIRQMFEHMVQTGETLTGFQRLWIDPDNPKRDPMCWNWSMVPVQNADGHVEGLVLSLKDVTESVHGREALRESERKEMEARRHLAAIMESSEDAILSVTRDGTVTSWNDGARRIWGYEHKEIVGRSVRRLMIPHRIPDEMARLRQVFAGRPIGGFDTMSVTRSGERLHVNVSLSAVRGDDGRVVVVAVSARDITARKRMEMDVLQVIDEERQRARYELHELLAQRLSGTAMLCRALGRHLTQIAASGNGSAKYQPLSRSAEQIEDELRAAIGQTTALAHGLMPVAPRPEALMDSLQELARKTSIERAISCTFQCERSVRVEDAATANQLYRVAEEAISNAVRGAKATAVVLALRRSDGAIQMTISDNGISRGDEQVPARCLAPGDGRPRRGPSPTGVQVMTYRAGSIGGSLTVEKNPEGGTVVRVNVPLQADDRDSHMNDERHMNGFPNCADEKMRVRGG